MNARIKRIAIQTLLGGNLYGNWETPFGLLVYKGRVTIGISNEAFQILSKFHMQAGAQSVVYKASPPLRGNSWRWARLLIQSSDYGYRWLRFQCFSEQANWRGEEQTYTTVR